MDNLLCIHGVKSESKETPVHQNPIVSQNLAGPNPDPRKPFMELDARGSVMHVVMNVCGDPGLPLGHQAKKTPVLDRRLQTTDQEPRAPPWLATMLVQAQSHAEHE